MHRRRVVASVGVLASAVAFLPGMGGIPLTCTGRPRTFTVNVMSLDLAFEPGGAQASALVLIERRGRTQQAQDSEVVQLA
jgi:hypothetical protein